MTETAIREFCVAGLLRSALGLVSLCVACSSGTSSADESASEAQSPDSNAPSTATNQPNPANGPLGDVPGSVVGSSEPAAPLEPAAPSEPVAPLEPAAPEGPENPVSVDLGPSPAPSPEASPVMPSTSDPPQSVPADDAGMGPEGAAGASSLVDAGGPDSRSCDTRDLLCRRAEPPCPQGQVPEIVNNCYGECVPIDSCECDAPEACPHTNEFTCVQSTGRCSYYLR